MKKLVSLLLVLVFSMSLVGCGFKANDIIDDIVSPGKDFRMCKFGDSIEKATALESNKDYEDYGPGKLNSIPQMSTWNSQYVKNKNMHVLLYPKAKVGGESAEMVYAFMNNKLAIGIVAFNALDEKDSKKLYDALVEKYDAKYGNASASDGTSRLYMKGKLYTVVAYDGKTNVGITFMDNNYL